MEDFEFKPLTDGLGFHNTAGTHKRDENAKSATSSAATLQSSAQLASQFGSQLAAKNEAPRSALKSAPTISAKTDFSSGSESSRSHSQPVSQPISQSISDLIASLPPSLDFIEEQKKPRERTPEMEPNLPLPDGPRPQIFQPFAREDFKAGSSVLAGGPTVGSALGAKNLTSSLASSMASSMASSPYRERLDESFARAFPHAERRPEAKSELRSETHEAKATAKRLHQEAEAQGLQAVASHFGAGFLDAMIVTGVGTILLVAIILITHINLWGLLSNAQTDRPTQLHIALLFISVMQLYLLTARSFFGASLGEWAFDLQLGTREDQQTTIYPLLVAWRTLIITLTGIVILPAISLLLGRDLASQVTGLQLYRRI